ncbi:hypothetical protein B0H14DRAFT_3433331 [Mycena olivaceomarginata]|nr:hypothetical protein B0H14DRAFT_3433331 [Mycena olivaceomarginata]
MRYGRVLTSLFDELRGLHAPPIKPSAGNFSLFSSLFSIPIVSPRLATSTTGRGKDEPAAWHSVIVNAARDALGTVCRLGPDIRSAARLVLWSRAFRWTQFPMTPTDLPGTEPRPRSAMPPEPPTEPDPGARTVNTPGFCALLIQAWRLLVRSEHCEWRVLGLQCLFAFLEEAGNTVHYRENTVSAAGESLDALAATVVDTISLIPPSTAKPTSLETYQLLHNVLSFVRKYDTLTQRPVELPSLCAALASRNVVGALTTASCALIPATTFDPKSALGMIWALLL